MGQEQSYTHASTVNRYQDYEGPYRTSQSNQLEYTTRNYEQYKRHKALKGRRSTDSFKSETSSTESSGYRSGSSACECRSDYYCTSLYKNDHYKGINKELYKPVKIPKEKRYKLQLFDLQKDELKSARLKSYLSEDKVNTGTNPKKTGIRNYTPKILEEEQKKKDWK